jgi:hypothetical protein
MAINTSTDKTGYPLGSGGLVFRGYASQGEYAYTTSLPAGSYVATLNGALNATLTGGINFSSNPALPPVTLNNALYFKTTAAETGTVAYVAWTTRLLNTGATAAGIAYGSVGGTGTYVAVGAVGVTNGTIANSTDLITWTSRTTFAVAQNFTSVIYSANATTQFILGGASGTLAFSTDGATWTAVTTSGFGTSQISCLATDNTTVLAGGAGGFSRYYTLPLIALSAAQAVTPSFGTSTISGAAYGLVGGTTATWVMAGAGGTITYAQSATPTTFTTATLTPTTTNAFNAVAFNNTGTYKFVAGGASGTIYASTNGVSWIPATNANFGTSTVSAITYNTANNLWYACGAGGTLRASTDGLTWVTRTSGQATAMPAMIYGASQGICATAGSNAVAPQGAIITLWKSNLATLN